jgi:hypothetical protein
MALLGKTCRSGFSRDGDGVSGHDGAAAREDRG